MERTYRIREFAELAGVTVRALHHYDRLGLLRPRRTTSGYRAYSSRDLETLEQIVALKFIGLPLKKIKTLTKNRGVELSTALRAQRTILSDKRQLLDQAIRAIRAAEAALANGGSIESGVFRRIIEVIHMQHNTEEWKKQYDALVQGKLDRLKTMSPEAKSQVQQEWTDLLKDVGEALDEDPAGARAQALGNRWARLLGAFAPSGGVDPSLVKKFGAAYPSADLQADATKWQGKLGDPRVWDFMRRVLAARK